MDIPNLEQYTLSEWLTAVFFEKNNKTFQIIYDKNEILKDFFEEKQDLYDRYKILMIEAFESPNEFISRLEIVNDFNVDNGWYNHNWIIYVYGPYVDKVEKFESFYYYGRIGKIYIFNTFLDLLILSDIGLIHGRQEDSVLEEYMEYNKDMVNILLDVPLSCFISKDRLYQEAATWMMILASKVPLFRQDNIRSNIWNRRINVKNLFDINNVILELIYRYDPLNLESLDIQSRNLMGSLFNFIEKKLNSVEFFTSSSDFYENMKKFMKMLVLHGRSKYSLKTRKRQKIKDLRTFLENKDIGKSNHVVKNILVAVMNEWINSLDDVMINRYQIWMNLLRKEFTKIQISKENINDTLKKFSYTGYIDISIMNYLLENIKDVVDTSEKWGNLLNEIIDKRQEIWEKNARPWWKHKKLFINQGNSINIEGMWNFIKQLGLLHFYEIPDDADWGEVEKNAWEIELINNNINKPNIHQILQLDEGFKPIKVKFIEMKNKYKKLSDKFNEIFIRYYKNEFFKDSQNSMADQGCKIFNMCIEQIKKDEKIAIIFCDGLRRDLSIKMRKMLNKYNDMEKLRIKTFKIKEYPCYSYLPSTTQIGWNAILRYENNFVFKPIYEKEKILNVELAIKLPTNELKTLRTPKDRIERVKSILQSSGKSIEIFEINVKKIQDSLKQLRKKDENKDKIQVPIIWFDKIDNHNIDMTEFYLNIDVYLEEIVQLIFKLHEMNYIHVYIFTDHGFIFGNNDNILSDIPKGRIEKRYCISENKFSDEEQKRYNQWYFFDYTKHNINLKKGIKDDLSIITPRNLSLFKKAKTGNLLFTHGGLSYQECSLEFLHVFCKLNPIVEILSIQPMNELSKNYEGKEAYILKKIEDSYYLEVQLITTEEKDKKTKLQPILIRIIPEDDQISIDKNNEIKLKPGETYIFKLSFNKRYQKKKIRIKIIDSKNNIIKTKEFSVMEPSSIYNGELF
ncbi:MAG: PglZ domain-containing protein [Promethearchaeota archaeon]